MTGRHNDDPRKLRTLIEKASALAKAHSVTSVVVGLAAEEGDLQFPEFLDYLQSALRVEDGIFRMTRERAVLHLADVNDDAARDVLDRILRDFIDEFPSLADPLFEVRLLKVTADDVDTLSVKSVLKALFEGESSPSIH